MRVGQEASARFCSGRATHPSEPGGPSDGAMVSGTRIIGKPGIPDTLLRFMPESCIVQQTHRIELNSAAFFFRQGAPCESLLGRLSALLDPL